MSVPENTIRFEEFEPADLYHIWHRLTETLEDTIWTRAKLAWTILAKTNLTAKDAAKELALDATARHLGHESKCSASYVRKLAKTYEAFPDADDPLALQRKLVLRVRAADLTFEHHAVAAICPDPERAIEAAVEHGWSSKQMRVALRPAGKARTAPEKVRKYYAKLRAEEKVAFLKEALSTTGLASIDLELTYRDTILACLETTGFATKIERPSAAE